MKKTKTKTILPVRLDLSFGEVPAEGFAKAPGLDPLKFPWPLSAGSVAEACSTHLLHRIAASRRGAFMDEAYRVLAPGAKFTVIVPYATSVRAIQDPLAEWPPFVEQSFLYFNRKFREDNKLSFPWKCDFDFVYGYSYDPETMSRPDDSRPFWIKHYNNVIADLQVVLTKR